MAGAEAFFEGYEMQPVPDMEWYYSFGSGSIQVSRAAVDAYGLWPVLPEGLAGKGLGPGVQRKPDSDILPVNVTVVTPGELISAVEAVTGCLLDVEDLETTEIKLSSPERIDLVVAFEIDKDSDIGGQIGYAEYNSPDDATQEDWLEKIKQDNFAYVLAHSLADIGAGAAVEGNANNALARIFGLDVGRSLHQLLCTEQHKWPI